MIVINIVYKVLASELTIIHPNTPRRHAETYEIVLRINTDAVVTSDVEYVRIAVADGSVAEWIVPDVIGFVIEV